MEQAGRVDPAAAEPAGTAGTDPGAAAAGAGPQGQPGPGGQPGPAGPEGQPGHVGAQGPPGLTAGIGKLIESNKALREEVAQLADSVEASNRAANDARRGIRWLAGVVVGALLGGAVALGGAYTLIHRNNDQQAAEGMRRGEALCHSWRVTSDADVGPATTDLGRVIVRTAAASYTLLDCEREYGTGPLPDVDPDAYRPAPAPTK